MKISKITKSLFLISILASFLIIIKGDVLSEDSIVYLVWNLCLAWVPYLISSYCIKKDTKLNIFIPIFIVWLLFFPNAPYLVTDIIHVTLSSQDILWYDSLIFFLFAWIGLLLGMISLFQIEQYINIYVKPKTSELIIFAICILSSIGIYFGRFERLNSWDLFTHPINIFSSLKNILTNNTAFIFIVIFTIFIYSMYKTIGVLFLVKEE